ncbi:type II secretion system protein [Ralstonia pickettii]|uniref:Type II secretion system protein n=1 Tax=Ralstonia pickettii TaxID=329 RepID=A0A7X2HRR4_RALPI|nr:type II secretion system protein [Ralstonia pickettii]MRT01055.1 type II secretion system protein [Ralstonia pickettii]NWK43862.1 type II secretion system protein [Ralstonia pickettii]
MPPRNHVTHQHGAILLESLVALAVLSLGAAAMLHALDHVEATSHAARALGVEARAYINETETR